MWIINFWVAAQLVTSRVVLSSIVSENLLDIKEQETALTFKKKASLYLDIP
jgi:hypothetical protein